jgi:hypothetical protein
MQYALLIYSDPAYLEEQPPERVEAIRAEYAVLLRDPRLVTSSQLQPSETATSVRVAEGRTLLTDGPFADTKEVLGGICIVDAPDLDEAIELARRIPAVRLGGTVEIRPVVQG